MSCRRQQTRLFSAVDGTLSLDERFALDAHLETCARCRELAHSLDGLDAGLAALPEPPLEHLDLDAQVRAIRERGGSRARPVASVLRWRVAAAAALIVGTTLGAILFARRASDEAGRALESKTDDARCTEMPAPRIDPDGEQPRDSSPELVVPTKLAPADRSPSAAPDERTATTRETGENTAIVAHEQGLAPAVSVAPASDEPATRDEPGARDDEELARRSAARQRLADALVATWSRARNEEREPLALAFADATRELAREGVPIQRVAADLADSTGFSGLAGDVDVARAALRYLGTSSARVGGGRFELRSLERALKSAELHEDAALALVDVGEAGAELVARECTGDADPAPLFMRLAARRDRDAALTLERIVRELARRVRGPREPAARRASLAARGSEAAHLLALHPSAGVESLLRLARDGSLTLDELGALLALAPEGRARLDELLRASRPQLDPRATLQAIATLRPPAGVEWLCARALDARGEAQDALAVLADYGDSRSLQALLRLSRSGRLASDTIETALDRALERGPESAAQLAREFGERRDRVGLAQLFDELARAPRAEHVSALLEIARAELLPDVERRAALELATEFGEASDCVALAELFRALPARERELRAATIVALHQLGGRAGLERVFTREADSRVTRLATLLEAPGATTRLSNTLFRVARELDAAADTFLP